MERRFININGLRREIIVDPEETLVNVLRQQLGLTGTKLSCGVGQCGACNVIMDGKVVRSCIVKMKKVPEEAKIITIEGIGTPLNMSPVQKAMGKTGATQCGFCIPGFVVTATALLNENPNPTREEVRAAFVKGNNLCRCTGYKPIVDAVMEAAKVTSGQEPESYLDWKMPADGKIWGDSVMPRVSAADKACGTAQYGADMGVQMPKNTLRLALVQATVSHANIIKVDTSEAEKMPGVDRVLTAKDVLGRNRIYGCVLYPWSKTDGYERPILCDEKVFQYGDAIAIVAADTDAHARAAADKVVIEYEELPAYMDAMSAAAPDALEIHPGQPNEFFTQHLIKGEPIDEVLEKADHIVSNNFYTSRQPHLIMEPDVGFSYMDGDTVVIQSKSISVYTHKVMIASGLGVEMDKIRIIQNMMGGSFGYKLSPTMEALCAVVSIATGRPAYLEYDCHQTLTYTGKRSPVFMDMALAADKNGKFIGCKSEFYMDHGPYSEFGDLLTVKILRNTAHGYHVPNMQGIGHGMFTNHAFGSAMRAYGAPQAEFCSEILVDQMAEKLGMDPWDIRKLNVYQNETDTCPTGDTLQEFPLPGLLDMIKPKYEMIKARCAEKNANSTDFKYGVGLAVGCYNVGRDSADAAGSTIELNPDGSVTIRNTWEDHGQGGDQGALQTAHEALRETLALRPDQIHLALNDTLHCPNSGPAAASRSQFIVGNAIVQSCEKLVEAMKKDDGTYRTYDEMIAENIPVKYEGNFTTAPFCSKLEEKTMQYKPVVTYMYGVFLAEVEVELKTGKVKVLSMTSATDHGIIGNRLLVEGQVCGGLVQGIGFALTEDFDDIKKHSTLRGAGMLPIKDVTDDIEIMIQQTFRKNSAFGAAGCGELPHTAPAPAIMNAIYNACGARVTSLPARPEKVLAAMPK